MNDLLNDVLPLLQELVMVFAGAAIIWATTYAKRKWGIDIEAGHRDALHSAIRTAVEAAVANGKIALGGAEPPKIGQTLRQELEAAARRSVPDAIAMFSPLPDVMDRLVMSKVAEVWQAHRAARP